MLLKKNKSLALCASLAAVNVNAGGSSLETYGDIMATLLPIAAYTKTWTSDDEEGRTQFYKAGAGVLITTQTLKRSVTKLRPSESNSLSFPSGHTSSAFMGAAFFQQRYGWAWGAPAYLLAAGVGYSRVDADAHYADDVLAGANMSVMFNLLFVTPQDSPLQVKPFVEGEQTGISLSYNGDNFKAYSGEARDAKFIYTFNFGPS